MQSMVECVRVARGNIFRIRNEKKKTFAYNSRRNLERSPKHIETCDVLQGDRLLSVNKSKQILLED